MSDVAFEGDTKYSWIERKRIAAFIKTKRKENKLTQTSLCKIVNVSLSTVSSIELARESFCGNAVTKILEYFGTTIDAVRK